jgi:replicative DNA helicase
MGSGGAHDNENERIADVSRQAKAIAKELSVPVVAVAQLNRGLEQRSDKRPQLSDLRGSGQLEQDADKVLFLYRDDVYNTESAQGQTTEVIVAKNRNGQTGTAHLSWQAHLASHASIARYLE